LKICKNWIHLTVSDLGTMTRTTGHVLPLILQPLVCKADGYGPAFEGLLALRKQKICVQSSKSAIPIYYVPGGSWRVAC
jgi:hypothetical protein